MAVQVLSHLALFTLFSGAAAWKCAKYEHYFSQQPDYIDCFWDCCGNSFNRHCCAPIGIIVGCCIIGAVVLAGMVVVCSCWMHRRRAKLTKGPNRFRNRRHSHYPVAPSSVTRPAPMTEKPAYGPPPGMGYGPPPPGGRGYGPPSDRRPAQSDYYNEKPPIDDFYNEKPEMTSTMGRGHGPPPSRGHPQNRGPPPSRGPRRDEMSSNDEYSDFDQREPPRGGYRPAPLPSRPVKPPPKEFIEL